MITGELKAKVDRIWDTMWSGGISSPLSVIEQLTYLLFIKRIDEIQTLKEHKASRTGRPIEAPIFSARQKRLRWSHFKQTAPAEMFTTVRDDVFPFIKSLGHNGGEAENSTYTPSRRTSPSRSTCSTPASTSPRSPTWSSSSRSTRRSSSGR